MNSRTCVGCRRKAEADELFRVVVGPSGELTPGAGQPGRGAWLCRGSVPCLDAAIQRKAFTRALRVGVPAGATEALRGVFEGREASMCEDVGPQLAAEQDQSRGTTQLGGLAAKD